MPPNPESYVEVDIMNKSTRLLAFSVLIALSLVLSACSSGGGATPSTSGGGGQTNSGTTVVEQNFAFNPSTLTVKVGDTVTFENQDSTAHDVKIDGKDLGSQDPGKSVTWTASKAGSFPYQCIIHPSMTGTIVVK